MFLDCQCNRIHAVEPDKPTKQTPAEIIAAMRHERGHRNDCVACQLAAANTAYLETVVQVAIHKAASTQCGGCKSGNVPVFGSRNLLWHLDEAGKEDAICAARGIKSICVAEVLAAADKKLQTERR